MKKVLNEGNQIHKFILCVCENFCDSILIWFRNIKKLRFRLFDKLLFRFLFHTAKSYGSYGSGSGSTTLQEINVKSTEYRVGYPHNLLI